MYYFKFYKLFLYSEYKSVLEKDVDTLSDVAGVLILSIDKLFWPLAVVVNRSKTGWNTK